VNRDTFAIAFLHIVWSENNYPISDFYVVLARPMKFSIPRAAKTGDLEIGTNKGERSFAIAQESQPSKDGAYHSVPKDFAQCEQD
jgi:hypothetical protein